jgi:hypothetical protein
MSDTLPASGTSEPFIAPQQILASETERRINYIEKSMAGITDNSGKVHCTSHLYIIEYIIGSLYIYRMIGEFCDSDGGMKMPLQPAGALLVFLAE